MSAALRRRSLACLAALTLVVAHAHAGERERILSANPDELINTGGWKLLSANGEGSDDLHPGGAEIVVSFERHAVDVAAPCNRMHGEYKVAGRHMTLQGIAPTTRMACDDARGAADRRFAALMAGKFRAEIAVSSNPYRLRLSDDDGRTLEFEALPMRF